MSSVEAEPARIHLHSLTALRFYAAVLVVLFHVSKIYDPLSWISPVVGFGHAGVTFFFILSGFVLTWSHRPDDTKRNFYLRRFARVWPLHALATASAVALMGFGVLTIVWPALPAALTLTQAWLPGDGRFSFNLVSWSLSCEAFFYLLFPFLIVFLHQRRGLFLISSIIFLSMIVFGVAATFVFNEKAFSYLLYTMPAYRIGEFLIGMCLALAIRRGWRPRFSLYEALALTMAVYAAVMAATLVTAGTAEAVPAFVTNLFLGPCFVAVIAAAATGDIRGNGGFLRSLWSRRLGEWSFALYLIHFMIFKITEPYIDQLDQPLALLYVTVLIAAAVGLSGILYHYFERPLEKRIRALVKKRQLSSKT